MDIGKIIKLATAAMHDDTYLPPGPWKMEMTDEGGVGKVYRDEKCVLGLGNRDQVKLACYGCDARSREPELAKALISLIYLLADSRTKPEAARELAQIAKASNDWLFVQTIQDRYRNV